MSNSNLAAVRDLYRGWAQGEFGGGIEHFDPDVEFISDFSVDRTTGRGLEGMRRVWGEHLRNWKSWHTGEIRDLRVLEEHVLVVHAITGRGRESGVEVEIPDAAAAFRFRNGKIVWLLVTARLETALTTLGLRE